MNSEKSVYSTIFDFYELQRKSAVEKRKMRRLIDRHLQKAFKTCTEEGSCDICGKKNCEQKVQWSQLTEFQQKRFLYVYIKEAMFTHYVEDSYKQKKIEMKISKEFNETLLNVDLELYKYNQHRSKVFNVYYNNEDSDKDKHNAYKQFCRDYKEIASEAKLPTFEEWVEQNKPHPLRIYDYMMDNSEETPSMVPSEQDILDSKLDFIQNTLKTHRIILDTIIKILKIELSTEINVSNIEECLTFLQNFDIGDASDELQTEYNPDFPASKEEQEKTIDANKKYIYYQKMLDELIFYQRVKK